MRTPETDPTRHQEGADRYGALLRTAAVVRARPERTAAVAPAAPRGRGRVLAAGVALAVAAWQGRAAAPQVALADSGADSQLFQLTNQDRTSNGVGPLGYLSSLQNIGESWAYSCSGITVHGRAADMLQRNYFSHVILGCGQYVFSMMAAYGVGYRSAGENIGWSGGFNSASASVGYINNAFMNSPEHRANILSASFTGMGVGSGWEAGPWTGAGSQNDVSMFAEEFVQQGSPAPAPTAPPPPPRPAPTARPTTAPAPRTPPPAATPEPRNEPAPTPSLPVPVATVVPSPAALAPPRPRVDVGIVPATAPTGVAAPPLEVASGGLISDGIDSVLMDLLLG